MKKNLTIIGMLLLLTGCSGCSAYNSLIGHPLHVLWQQHENVEAEKAAYATNHVNLNTNAP